VATTTLAVSFDGLAFSMLFSALGIRVPLVSAAAAHAALLYVYLLPAAPGYVGSLEVAGTTFLTGELGLPSAIAAGAVTLWHVIGATTILAFGLVALRQVVLPLRGRRRSAVG